MHEVRGLGLSAITRLAVTCQQVDALGLPTSPPKPTDRRSFKGETVQAEAIPPDVLTDILKGAIHNRIDFQKLMAVEQMEIADKLNALEGGAQ